MPKLYDGVDIFWDNTAGDFALSSSGDLAGTEFDPLIAIAQEIEARVKSDRNDWKEAPFVGATLREFVGEPNSRETGVAIKSRIRNALSTYNAIDPGDVSIDIFPLSAYKVAIKVDLRVMPTIRNKRATVLQKTFIYDWRENNVFARN